LVPRRDAYAADLALHISPGLVQWWCLWTLQCRLTCNINFNNT
jgi:hypothetical protein